MKFDAILFDFDGTLAELTIDFDLMKRKLAALGECFLDERPEPGDTPALEWLDRLAREIGSRNPAQGQEFHSRGRLVITAMELDAAREGRLFPFTRDVLADLRRRGIRTGIITRNITPAVKTVYPEIEQECDAFLAREDAKRVKPDPAHALQALDRMNALPERTLMVGDHLLDMETARRAGTRAAAVTSGKLGPEAFAACAPDFLAPDVAELMNILESDKAI